MLRHLYRCVVQLHPLPFRQRFGEEMLSLFDLAQTRTARFGLLFDGILSSFRQWVLRPQFWAESSPSLNSPVAEGIPTFSSLDNFRPRTSAVIDGLVFSAILFTLMCFSIRYSWIRVLHIQIPGYQIDSYLGFHPAVSPSDLRGAPSKPKERSPNVDSSGLISEHLQVDVMPVEAGTATTPTISAQAPPQATPVQLQLTGNPAGLQLRIDRYVGTYKSQSPQMTIEIKVEDNQLSIHIPGEPTRALAAASQTTFAMIGDENSWIEFIPGTSGKMQRLVLSRGAQQIAAERP